MYDFVEYESNNPGNGRLYRLTTNNGSRNISDLGTLSETITVADGVLTGMSLMIHMQQRHR